MPAVLALVEPAGGVGGAGWGRQAFRSYWPLRCSPVSMLRQPAPPPKP